MEDAEAAVARLRAEGWSNLYVWEDRPGATYPPHTHDKETAHLVVRGAITVSTGRGVRTYRTGERFDLPAGDLHSAVVGPEGCVYVVGER